MIDINELRRLLDSRDMIDGIDLHANIKPIIREILGRLEAAERERDALRAKVEAAEQERDRYKLAYNDCIAKTEWLHRADAVKLEIDRLRAEIEEVKKREREACTKICDDGWNTAAMGILAAGIRARGEENEKKLYTIPGAQQGE